jgi:DNA-directed RNA polymerase specialized sigma24 family protein
MRATSRAAPAPADADEHAEPAPASSDRFEDLYLRHVPRAAALGALLTGDGELGRALAHRAFLRATGRFQHLRSEDRFRVSLLRNLVAVFLVGEREREGDGEPASSEGAWGAVLALPPRERAAVVLRHAAGLTEAETAAALRCSVPTVRAALARGLDRLS